MQKQKSLPLLLIHFLSIIVVSNAQNVSTKNNSDSLLPACILQMKEKDSLVISTEYNYKGQRWFAIGKRAVGPPPNYSDKQTITKFYNDSCQLVCTWTKGGIAALNRVKPDSIEKEKIIAVIPLKENIPDTILNLAISKNAITIDKYDYKGEILYRIMEKKLSPAELQKKGIMVLSEPYYNAEGKIILEFRRAAASMFYRAQMWIPSTTDPGKLKNHGPIWRKP